MRAAGTFVVSRSLSVVNSRSELTTHHRPREPLDVHDDFRLPAAGRLLDAQPVIGNRLHLVAQLVPRTVQRLAPGAPLEPARADTHLETAEQQVLGVDVI